MDDSAYCNPALLDLCYSPPTAGTRIVTLKHNSGTGRCVNPIPKLKER